MSVTGRRTWYIAVVILGREFTYRRLTWDDALIAGLVEAEADFWNRHIVTGVLPDPDGSKTCDEVLNQYFHAAKKAGPLKLDGFDEKLERRNEIIAAVKELEEEQKRIEQEIKLSMKDHEYAASEKYYISWSSVSSARLDAARIKAERPEIYKEYVKVSSSRRFQVKAA